METVSYTLPAYWASYLINGDSSGIEDEDIAACDAFCESIADEVKYGPVDCSEESWFSKYHDAWAQMPLGGNVMDFVWFKA